MTVENNQFNMEDELFHEEREELLLLAGLAAVFNSTCHVRSRCEATMGAKPAGSKHQKALKATSQELNNTIYWIALIQSLTSKALARGSNFKEGSVDDFLENAPPVAYQVDLVSTPHGIYESYLRVYRDIERVIKMNQKVVDRLPKGNEIVTYLFDALQEAGEHLEKIL
jgi:hypothetical protein